MFTVEAVTNKKNDRRYACSSRDLSVNFEVILDARKLITLCFGLLLHLMWGEYPLVFIDEAWNSKTKFIWTCCRKNFSRCWQKLLRINSSSHKTVLQLTQRIWPRSGAKITLANKKILFWKRTTIFYIFWRGMMSWTRCCLQFFPKLNSFLVILCWNLPKMQNFAVTLFLHWSE